MPFAVAMLHVTATCVTCIVGLARRRTVLMLPIPASHRACIQSGMPSREDGPFLPLIKLASREGCQPWRMDPGRGLGHVVLGGWVADCDTSCCRRAGCSPRRIGRYRECSSWCCRQSGSHCRTQKHSAGTRCSPRRFDRYRECFLWCCRQLGSRCRTQKHSAGTEGGDHETSWARLVPPAHTMK